MKKKLKLSTLHRQKCAFLVSRKNDHAIDGDHTIDVGDYTIDGSLELSFWRTFINKNFVCQSPPLISPTLQQITDQDLN